MNIIPIKSDIRTCGECTKCCEGNLVGDAYGYQFGNGVCCHFLEKNKCTIYPNHPKDPCKSYQCYWLENKEIPDYMRPDKSNILMTHKVYKNFNYVEVKETDKKMDGFLLAEVVQYFLLKNMNLECKVGNKFFYYGSQDFMVLGLSESKQK